MHKSSLSLLAAGIFTSLLFSQSGCHTLGHSAVGNVCSTTDCSTCPNGSGTTFGDCCHPRVDGLAARRLGCSALTEISRASHCEFSDDYEDGFEQAFEDIAEGGNGVLPPAPPSKYWKEKYRCPEGSHQVEEWYSGYHAGVQHAYIKGVHRCNEIYSRQDFIESTLDNGCYGSCVSAAGVTYVGPRRQLPVEREICNSCPANNCLPSGCTSGGNCTSQGGAELISPQPIEKTLPAAPASPPAAPKAVPAPKQVPETAPMQPVPAERPTQVGYQTMVPGNGYPLQYVAPMSLQAQPQIGHSVQMGQGIQVGHSIQMGHSIQIGHSTPTSGRPLSWGPEPADSTNSDRRIDSLLFQ
ncbi:MAG: hypothetical protein CMJ46_06165 [Planctomyces sp.]|nr:hypothetical protein [Planctomyces sp.]